VLLLSSNLAANAVEIDDPTRREFHALGSRTSAQGYYSIAGVARLRTAQWRASAAGFSNTPVVTLTIDYEQPVNPVDFRL
jgi:hypothetical protein